VLILRNKRRRTSSPKGKDGVFFFFGVFARHCECGRASALVVPHLYPRDAGRPLDDRRTQGTMSWVRASHLFRTCPSVVPKKNLL
jgi:hypothetical protein